METLEQQLRAAQEYAADLASVIERARKSPPVETFDGGIRQDTVYTILETVDTRAVLAEHDREVAEKAWDEGAYHSAGDACMSVRHGDPCPQNPYRTGWWESSEHDGHEVETFGELDL
jgi:hypothetical protein